MGWQDGGRSGRDGGREGHDRLDGEWYRGTVPPSLDGASVAHFLRGHLGASRRMVRRLKARGAMLVNGRPVVVRERLRVGDEVVLVLPDLPSPNIEPEEQPLRILFEDDAIIVVDKPAGVLVHPVGGQGRGTLAQAVAFHLETQGLSPRPRPVHRLDRDTSGVIIFAKNAHAHHRLAGQFDRHELTKEYLAVVWGRMVPDHGLLRGALKRDRGRMTVVEEGDEPGARPVATGYRVKERLAGGSPSSGDIDEAREATVLLLYPQTGRTHQIRAQLAAAGHPVVGDRLYGPSDPSPGLIGRQALHALSIAFRHPVTGLPVRFAAPVPPDIAGLIEALGGRVDP